MKGKNILLIYIIAAASIMLMSQQVYTQEPSLKLYGLKSGIIEYKYAGNQVGKSTLYFDDYGNKSAAYTDAMRGKEKDKTWIISLGENQFIFDPDKPNEGLKMKNPMFEWLGLKSRGDYNKITDEWYSKLGYKKVGTENFLGKECNLYKGQDGKVLTWNGIMMLMDIKIAGTHTHHEAISIKTNIPVDQKYFVVPKNIKFSEMPMLDNPYNGDEKDDVSE